MVCVATAEAVAIKSQALPTWVDSILGTGDDATCTWPAADFCGPGSNHRPWLPADRDPAPPHSARRSQHTFRAGGSHTWHPAVASVAE